MLANRIASILLCASVLSTPAFGACPGAAIDGVGSAAKAVHLNGLVFFRTSGLELDFDGNPHAYGVRDQGEENICVGLAPIAPPCHAQYQGACYPVCQRTFAAWSRGGSDPGALAKTMCSVGLGGGGCSKPDLRLQDAPNQDWFVSETSLKVSPESGAVESKWLHSQNAQLNPGVVRYLVVPGALTKSPWNVRFGDVGIAYNAKTKEPVSFIVGDGGGLGEGSESLLAALRPDDPPRLKAVQSALGDQVMRYTRGVDGDFRFVIFTRTASRTQGTGTVTTLTADHLDQWITATATAALQKQSNPDEVFACSELVDAISK